MTTPTLVAEHCDRAGRNAGDAHQNMKAHHASEERVNRGHRDTKHDGRVTRHRDVLSGLRANLWTSLPLLARGIGAERALADPPNEGIAERDHNAKNEPRPAAERERARYVSQYCRCHAKKEGPGVTTVRATVPARIFQASAPHPAQHEYPDQGSRYGIQ